MLHRLAVVPAAAGLLVALLLAADSPAPSPAAAAADRSASWPSFRGTDAAGVADGQNLPEKWSAAEGVNVRWTVPIPGLAHSSPVIWGDRIFLTTAISGEDDAEFKPGLYGDGTVAADRRLSHRFVVYALDKRTGAIIWQHTAREAVPAAGRHIKSTYANPTPVTDGRYLVAFFGPEGLYAYDLDGHPLWSHDLGRLVAAAYDAPDYEWGVASSPVIYGDLVIVQCDTSGDDFLVAFDLASGKQVWKNVRDELPSWSTPALFRHAGGVELVTNSPNFIRGHDPATGAELWRLGGSSKITAPTPVFAGDLLVVASGRRPEKPIFVIRAGARGDLTLPPGQTTSPAVAWSRQGDGPYMPTPLIYGDLLYSLNNNGVLDAYRLATGEQLYRQRIDHRGAGFSASPVAADGKLYLASEDGDVYVVRAGETFELLATNPLGEPLMATPALSAGTLYARGRHHLFAVGR